MSMVGARGYPGLNTTRSRDERALQALTGLLWETLTRVADGTTPDAEDLSVLANTQHGLSVRRAMIDYVTKAAAPPKSAPRGADALVDLIWIAAEQLNVEDLLGSDRSRGIDVVIKALNEVAQGNTQTAKTWRDVFGCVAMLSETSGGSAAPSF